MMVLYEAEIHDGPNIEGIDVLMEVLIDEGAMDGDALRMGLDGGNVVDEIR